MPGFYIERGDGFSYTILWHDGEDIGRPLFENQLHPTRAAALNAWIAELINNRERLNTALAAAQKKQRRWDQRDEGRNAR